MKFTPQQQLQLANLYDQHMVLKRCIDRTVQQIAKDKKLDLKKGNLTYDLQSMTYEYKENDTK